MTAAIRQPMRDSLRVLIVAADPDARLRLKRMIRELGHIAVSAADASIVLADGIEPPDGLPAVRFGSGGEESAGILPRTASADQVEAALRAVAVGLRVRPVLEDESGFQELERLTPVLLTPRETDVLNALANGLANKEIARQLGISLHTVKFHLESLMRKLEASSRTEAVTKALRLGLWDVLQV